MTTKVIIIGASTVGKTTLLKYLKENIDLPIDESDDVLIAMNGGVYPRENEYKMNELAPRMVNDLLDQDEIVFFTNTHYFSKTDLIIARDKGFKIFYLVLSREKMVERSKFRQKYEGYEDHTKYFDEMLAYQKDILDSGLVEAAIDADRSIEMIARDLLKKFS